MIRETILTCDYEDVVCQGAVREFSFDCASLNRLEAVAFEGFDLDGFLDTFCEIADASGCPIARIEDCEVITTCPIIQNRQQKNMASDRVDQYRGGLLTDIR